MTGLSVADLVSLSGDRLDASDFGEFDPAGLAPSGLSATRTQGGYVVLNDRRAGNVDSVAEALKFLVLLTPADGRSVAVLGPLETSPAEWRDDHDRIGRLIVRLNVHQLFVVGDDARHIHNAAGLEGSWDGESRLVATPDEAYDLLREGLREGDVVLVKSSDLLPLTGIAERLEADSAASQLNGGVAG